MIHGIGTDIVLVSRIEAALSRRGLRFAETLLHSLEMQAFDSHPMAARFLAKRFAAKEAFAKAFGTGMRRGFDFQDLCVQNHLNGQPYFVFSERLQALLTPLGIDNVHLSLSDEKDHALAFVILETHQAKGSNVGT